MEATSDNSAPGGDDEVRINARTRRKDRTGDEAQAPKASKQLNVTLGDCLACSGCITSAEAVLISEQSHEKVMQVLDNKHQVCLH